MLFSKCLEDNDYDFVSADVFLTSIDGCETEEDSGDEETGIGTYNNLSGKQ